jgi:hypothetical protein
VSGVEGSAPGWTLKGERVALYAYLVMLARLSVALVRARAIRLAA